MSDPAILSVIITGAFGLLGAILTVIIAPRLAAKEKRDKEKQERQEAEDKKRNEQRETNLDEARRLRDELRQENVSLREALMREQDETMGWQHRHQAVSTLFHNLRHEVLRAIETALVRLERSENDRIADLLIALKNRIESMRTPDDEKKEQ